MNILDFAYQVIEMQERITALKIENKRLSYYEEQYHKLLDESLEHNRAMMGNILKFALAPGVVEVCEKNKTFGVEL